MANKVFGFILGRRGIDWYKNGADRKSAIMEIAYRTEFGEDCDRFAFFDIKLEQPGGEIELLFKKFRTILSV